MLLKSDVTPKEYPTVANADTVSNSNGKKSMVSVIRRPKNAKKITRNDMVKMASALNTIFGGMCLLNK